MPRMLADAIRESGKELNNVATTMGQALKVRAVPRQKLRDINIRVAERAQNAVVAGWRTRLPSNMTGGKNRLSGRLGPALAQPSMTAFTTDRYISFINTDVLDLEAAHWYRVNYGAAGPNLAEGRMPARFVMQFNGSAAASFSDDRRPDPKSWIPARYYIAGQGLYAKSTEAVPNPSGARPARFFELGYRVIAKETPKAYDEMWRTHVGAMTETMKQRLTKKDIRVQGDWRATRSSWSYRVRRKS